MEDTAAIVLWLVILVGLAWLCGGLAKRKGYSFVLFFVLGFFFFLITLIVVLVLPSKTAQQAQSSVVPQVAPPPPPPPPPPVQTTVVPQVEPPPPPPPPPVQTTVVATFGPSTAWCGKVITFSEGQFALEDLGPTTAASVLEYDRQGHLEWPFHGMRDWVLSVAQPPSIEG